MKKVVNVDYSYTIAPKNLSSLTLKVLSNAHLSKEYFDNLFILSEEKPDNDNLKNIKNRLLKAKQNNEKVFVFGDYDADGVCATTLMVRLLQKLDIEYGYYIPDRLKEGYGLNTSIVQMALDKGYSLVITVDNGVSAFDSLNLIRNSNVECIVIDHHIIAGDYQYDYLLHPTVFTDYFKDMCGAGTTLQLIRYFELDDYIDWILAMIATIGDMVPVFLANREIIKKGLECLNFNNYLPIKCLSKKAVFDETTIAFDIVPQINTLGRLADRANANILVKYLLSDDELLTINTASKISDLNKTRQSLIKEMNSIEPDYIYENDNYLIYISENYHEGIIGLLANKIMNEKEKATIIFTKNEGIYKGSGRSPKGFDIYGNISKYQKYFSNFGGHEQACGLSVPKENFMMFINEILSEEKIEYDTIFDEAIAIDMNELTLANVKELFSFKPFGESFKLPNFYIKEMKVDDISSLKNNYKKTVSYLNGEEIEVLCFNEKFLSHLQDYKWENIVVSIGLNTFRNKTTVSLVVCDI